MHLSLLRLCLAGALALALGLWGAAGCDTYRGPGAPAEVAPSTAAAPAQVYGCGLPRGPGNGFDCGREEPHFEDHVVNAINQLRYEHPELFHGAAVLDIDPAPATCGRSTRPPAVRPGAPSRRPGTAREG